MRLSRRALPAELRSIRGSVDRWAAGWGIGGDALIDIQLAIGEAVANGIEHAYAPGEPGTVEVELEMCHAGTPQQAVSVQVTDRGRWLPATAPGYRGRGLQLIERVASNVTVQPVAPGTRVCFEIAV